MTRLRIEGVHASYRDTPVLHGIDLDVPSGGRTAILGPSGCGKTTLLRVVAGFHPVTAGTVRLDDEVVAGPGTWVPPERRRVGYVAQDGLLFPHLSIRDNIVFGLPRAQRRRTDRVDEVLDLVGLDPVLQTRHPDQLSGGQQQRVALARALITRPRIVLLDEPFSSLDAGLRASTRHAVAAAIAREGVTVVLVTHDQAEALSFAEEVAILRGGRFAQVDSPTDAYAAPRDRQTAEFLGEAVFLPGTAAAEGVTTVLGRLVTPDDGLRGPVDVMLRPEQIRLRLANGHGPVAEVVSSEYFGHDALVHVRLCDGGPELCVRVTGEPARATGELVGLEVAGPVRLYPAAP